MSEDKQEQEFAAYLEGNSELSKIYQDAANEKPSAHLDDKILAASRREVNASPRFAYSPFAGDWHVPASLVAVLVLSVGVVITMQRENIDYKATPASINLPVSTSADSSTEEAEISSYGTEDDKVEQRAADSIIKNKVDYAGKALNSSDEQVSLSRNARKRLEAGKEQKKDMPLLQQTAPVVTKPDFESYAVTDDISPLKVLPAEPRPKERVKMIIRQKQEKGARAQEQLAEGAEQVVVTAQKREESFQDTSLSVTVLEEVVVSSEEDTGTLGAVVVTSDKLNKPIQDKIEAINKLWDKGDKEKALEQLRQLLLDYPNYKQEELDGYFPEKLLNLLSNN